MKVLFAGPSLHGLALVGDTVRNSDILRLPPARQGDIARSVLQGATMIGLIDGRYEDVAAPWHKEILYALDQGVRVFGAASMGALRAAECWSFGMIPVGVIADRYIRGELTDDAAVAQIQGPVELGSVPLSEALVNVEASVEAATLAGTLSAMDGGRLVASARRIFFKDRTLPYIVEQAGISGQSCKATLCILQTHWRDVKREDALALVERMHTEPADRIPPTHAWRFREPSAWRRFLSDLREAEEVAQGA